MRLRLRVLALALLAGAFLGARRPADSPALQQTLAQLEESISAVTAAQAEATLAGLVAQNLDSPEVYRLYWRTLRIQKKSQELRDSARTTLTRLEGVPARKRSESEFQLMIGACSILDDRDRADQLRQEAIQRFPKGSFAKWHRWQQASEEKDPVRSAKLLQAVLQEYLGDRSVAPQVAMERLELVRSHPDRFTRDQLRDAAWMSEGLARRAWKAGSKAGAFWYVVATKGAAQALAQQWPEESLEIAARGMACFEASWPTDGALQADAPVMFWPGMLEAHAAAGRPEAARKVGEAILKRLEAADPSQEQAGTLDEANIRTNLAEVLEKLGAVTEARLQYGLAAEVDDAKRGALEAFDKRHPLNPSEAAEFQKEILASRAEILRRRDETVKRKVLAGQVDTPMYDFQVEDLQGKKVTLASFRGKTVVMNLWATWCGACIWEMEHLEKTLQRYRQNPKVAFAAVSIDWEREKVAPFVRDKKVGLPVYLAGESLERDFGIESIPQMFIIDAQGRMRFRLVDVLAEDRFQQSLDWMIEAAGK